MSNAQPIVSKDEITLTQVLECINEQREEHAREMTELRHQISILAKQNYTRSKEIEGLKKIVAEMKLKLEGCPSTALSLQIRNESDYDEFQVSSCEQYPLLSAKDAIRYIPILNGDDDIGVEDFIKEIQEMRSKCSQKELLLKAIKIEKIVGKAAQSIRYIPIENYVDLFGALRTNVTVEATSEEYGEQLQELKQRHDETVQSFNIRFRDALNKLNYAIINENPQSLNRQVILEATKKKIGRIYLKGLRHEIGRVLLVNESTTLAETEKKAIDIERYLREKQRDWKRGSSRVSTNRNIDCRPPQGNSRPTPSTTENTANRSETNSVVKTLFSERMQPICFKCENVGHIASQCRNFSIINQTSRFFPMVNQLQMGIEEGQYESTAGMNDIQSHDFLQSHFGAEQGVDEDYVLTPERETANFN